MNNGHTRPRRLHPAGKPDELYECRKAWPRDWSIILQWGTDTMPRFDALSSDTYIRGHGVTWERAEEHAWRQYQKMVACTGHVFDDRGFDSGAGWCVHCDMFSPNAFEPKRTPCTSCGRLTAFMRDTDGGVWCMSDWREIPVDKRTDSWTVFYNRPATLAGYIKDYRAKYKEPTV